MKAPALLCLGSCSDQGPSHLFSPHLQGHSVKTAPTAAPARTLDKGEITPSENRAVPPQRATSPLPKTDLCLITEFRGEHKPQGPGWKINPVCYHTEGKGYRRRAGQSQELLLLQGLCGTQRTWGHRLPWHVALTAMRLLLLMSLLKCSSRFLLYCWTSVSSTDSSS